MGEGPEAERATFVVNYQTAQRLVGRLRRDPMGQPKASANSGWLERTVLTLQGVG